MTDLVNSPPHYNQAGIECIDAILAATNHNKEGYLQGNILKYVWRYDYKGGLEDLQKAQMVADYLGTKHHSITVSEKEFLDYIKKVIYDIESYDTTTVRASVGNWLISKYISETSESKVIFNGDGSDEVCGGYMYFHASPNSIDFDKECRKLLKNIHYFDVLRSDRSISSHGLEARTPFLDRNFVQSYLSIPIDLRNHKKNNQCLIFSPEMKSWR